VEANSLANARNYVDQALTELSHAKAVSVPTSEPYGCSLHYAAPKIIGAAYGSTATRVWDRR
jgi:hypothetical protein